MGNEGRCIESPESDIEKETLTELWEYKKMGDFYFISED